jgi:hypothetical protein
MTEQQTPASVALTDAQIVQSFRDHYGFALNGPWPGVQTPHYALAGLFKMAGDAVERLSAEREGLRGALETELWWLKTVERLTNCRDTQTGAMGRITAIKAALTQGESRQTGWQDIATAPKDGRVVLVFSAARCVWSVVSAQWRQDWPNGGWDTISKHTTPIVPTHWMPLPAAPAPADGGGE